MKTRLVLSHLLITLLTVPLGAADQRDAIVLIAYYSPGGNTATMAKAVQEGARSVPRTVVQMRTIEQVQADQLLAADAIIVGTPVYNGGMAGEVKRFIDGWPFGRLKEKVGAAFCTGGGTSAGEELALVGILSSMLVFQFVVVGGDSWQAAFGASAITEEGRPSDKAGVDSMALDKARALGARVARVTHVFIRGTQQVAETDKPKVRRP
jgi:NAD(P)H dehydrogenase (quinone)